MEINEKIREQQKRLGLSQEELAIKHCARRQAVTKWENGV